ncbi:Armadillo [Artemisia annua]|uniref:Armadillo n=1 Tax=Artemisia annua TaxID=35608 RepID=A0A2U1LWL9_ARTAN|nr:Armadillo [Artemisia annua]
MSFIFKSLIDLELFDFTSQNAIGDFNGGLVESDHCFDELIVSIQGAKKLLVVAANFDRNITLDGVIKKSAFQFQCVSSKLEKALANLPYHHFDISEEVQEQVDLVRGQLRRARERYGRPQNSDKEVRPVEEAVNVNNLEDVSEGDNQNEMGYQLESSQSFLKITDVDGGDNSTNKIADGSKKSDVPVILVDFLCPISLELMCDLVIVSTGQTYERSYIQRWIDGGNTTCPKTQQKLKKRHFNA